MSETYETVSIDQVDVGDTVFIPSTAVVLRGQLMLQLPHVDGIPDRILALHQEWFAHARRRVPPPQVPLPKRDMIQACLEPYVAPDRLAVAVEVMFRTLEKHVEDEQVPSE